MRYVAGFLLGLNFALVVAGILTRKWDIAIINGAAIGCLIGYFLFDRRVQ